MLDVERFFAGDELTISHFTPPLVVLRYGTNLGTALQLAQFRDDAASQERAVAGVGGAVPHIQSWSKKRSYRGEISQFMEFHWLS